MSATASVESREKIALVWAERRERLIAVRVQYRVNDENGCRVYRLDTIREM
jgi:hypothetical protein